jgi:hypothetical protein
MSHTRLLEPFRLIDDTICAFVLFVTNQMGTNYDSNTSMSVLESTHATDQQYTNNSPSTSTVYIILFNYLHLSYHDVYCAFYVKSIFVAWLVTIFLLDTRLQPDVLTSMGGYIVMLPPNNCHDHCGCHNGAILLATLHNHPDVVYIFGRHACI